MMGGTTWERGREYREKGRDRERKREGEVPNLLLYKPTLVIMNLFLF